MERVSRIRELVLGAQDGLLVPLGVVTGMAAANPGRTAILVAGFAEAITGCIAMPAGSDLASEAEKAFYRAEIEDLRVRIGDWSARDRPPAARLWRSWPPPGASMPPGPPGSSSPAAPSRPS